MTEPILLLVVLLLLGLPAAFLAGNRLRRKVEPGALTAESLEFIRKLDKMILSNLSFTYLADQFANLLPSANRFAGGSLRTVDEQGSLSVVSVTGALADSKDPDSLHRLSGSSVTPEQMQRSSSLLTQAINQRKDFSTTELAQVTPELDADEATRVQKRLGINGIWVYPIIVEERIAGAITFYFRQPLSDVTDKEREIMRSITDELAIAIANAGLIAQLGDMNQKLAEANTHLQEMDATKDDFIAIASHQLRSPLTAVKGYLSMLEEGDYGDLSTDQRQVLTQLTLSTNELINLISDMLSVSRINAQRFELSRAPVALEEVIQNVVREFQPLAVRKGLTVEVHVPHPELGALRLDPLRIRQVIANLIDNAIKYTERGTVRVSLRREDNEVVFTVTDTGIGIPEDEKGNMFAKFYRAANARSIVVAGSGLGLYVVKRIVEDHGGHCIMDSREGKGSTFGFRIPTAVPAPVPVPA